MVRNGTVLGLNQLTNWGILTTDTNLTITDWNQWLEFQILHKEAAALVKGSKR